MKIQRRWQSTVAVMLALFSSSSFADYTLNMREGVSELSKEIFDLHMFVLWICVVIGVVVFGLMIYSMINHRKSKHPTPAEFHESTKVEILWTVIPLLILVVVAVPATKTLIKLEDASDSDVYIKITGYQWKWHYDYIDEGVSFFSQISEEGNAARQLGADPALKHAIALGENGKDKYLLDVDNPLVIPVGKKIGFLVTSNDVIHAWWSPDLAVKQDAVPGYINDTWAIVNEPGVYRGQCAELCGKDHGFMPVVVVAKTEADYAIWLAEQKSGAAAAAADSGKVFTQDELMAKGEGLYAKNCAACHGAAGESA
ncbi:MAG: cytochrome c oxidase subunit II, partial [Gammaproteobacteria bacterium]|nr:cytochrome c oxidase subunit II [Gammaproteobacteria bacterium]